jgi:hypothetical protein
MLKNNILSSGRLIHSSQSYDKKNKNNKKDNKKENLYRDIFCFNEEKDSSSEDDDNPEINIIIFYDGRKIVTKFNRHKPFSDFASFLQKRYFRVGFEENYKIFYGNVEIPMNDKRKIKKIVDGEQNEIKFIIKTKVKAFINSNLKKMYIELENIPSFMDLSNQINNFINSQKKSDINFDIIYKDNCCRILFSSSEIAFSFIAYMTNIKFNNKFYRKLKIDIKYNALEDNKYDNYRNLRCMSEEKIIGDNSDSKNSKNEEDKNKKKSIKVSNSVDIKKIKNKHKFIKRNNNINYKSNTESNNDIYMDYYEDNYESIQDSSPYGYENQLAKMEEMMNKKKWMGKKNFFTSINKNSFNRLITPNKYYLRLKNSFNNNSIRENKNKKIGINSYNNKIYKLKISEI